MQFLAWEVSEAKVTKVPFFDNPCRLFEKVLARDRFVNVGILPNVDSMKQNRVVQSGISGCSRIIRLTNNHTKSRKRATVPQRKREDTVAAVSTTIGLCFSRLGVLGISKRRTVSGKPDAKSLGINSKSSVHSVHATSSKYPLQQRAIAWKNTSRTSSSAKSSRYEIRGQISRRDCKTTAMRPKHGMESSWKTYTSSKRKDKATFYSPSEEWVLSVTSTKEPEKKSL